MPRDHSREQPQWLLARHSALTARQLLRAYGLLCLFSLTIAAAFALRGIWTIPLTLPEALRGRAVNSLGRNLGGAGRRIQIPVRDSGPELFTFSNVYCARPGFRCGRVAAIMSRGSSTR